MNAYTPPRPLESFEDRTIRHLQMCRELAELGMEAARNSAQAARHEWDARPQSPEPAPERAQAKPAAHTPRPQTPSDTPRRETGSPSLALARITHAVRQIIELEGRIAAAYRAELDREADRIATRAYRAAESQPKPAPTPHPHQPRPAQTREIPSLLANISREIGIDLQDPTLATRLPSFHHPP